MKNACKYLGLASWVVTALVSLDIGLGAFNQSFMLNSALVLGNMMIAQYVILASALFSLYGLVMALQGGKKGCGLCK